MIADKPSTPKTSFQDFSTLLYGAPKVGKSTFASQFDRPYFLDTEGGLNSLSVYKTPIGSWEDFKAFAEETRQALRAGKFPYRTLVFDTADNLKQMCSDYMCRTLKIMHESDLDYGKGWSMVRKEFNMGLASYKALGLGRLYISHANDKEIKTRTGSYTRWTHSLDGQARDIIEPEVDFIFFAEIIGDKRVLHTKPCDAWIAGDRTGKLPPEIDMNHATFMAEFEKALKK